MADDEFVPEKKTIEDLLVGAEYYVIPRFQRPYSWDRENVDDFWRDVIVDNQSGYFIGPMVAWRDKKASVRRLVDGQQRMTTIVILLAVLRSVFDELEETTLAEGIHRYLEKSDRDNQPQFTLRSESDWKFLNHAVLARRPSTKDKPKSDEDKALDEAYRNLKKKVAERVNEVGKPVIWLKEVRDRILNLTVIWVEHGNEDDAYIVFETLNSRGKDLEVVDLMKNHLLSKLKGAGNPHSDHARKQWQEMREALVGTDDRSTLDANTYIHRWWLTRNEYVAQKKLFRLAKSSIKTQSQAQTSLDSLEKETIAYRAALDPRSREWHSSEHDGARSLQALADFGIVQPAPALFSIVRKRLVFDDENRLSAKQFNKVLQAILRYHFQYTIIAQLSSSGGISEMYAKFARELFRAGTPQESSAIVSEFCVKLIQRAPERDRFVEAFAGRFLLTDKFNRESKLVKYVLGELLASASPGFNLSKPTIEHIRPQSCIESDADAHWIGSIGNLLLVDEDTNHKLANKEFRDKLRILHDIPYDVVLCGLNVESWDRTAIERRSKLLGELAYDKVWALEKVQS